MAGFACLLLLCTAPVPAAAPAGESCFARAGERVVDILERCTRAGTALVYSSDLVSPELETPRASDSAGAAEVIREVLRPHGLALAREGDLFFVVQRPASRPRGPHGHLSGVVRRAEDSVRVVGASIRLEPVVGSGTSASVLTGPAGDFHFVALPAGRYRLSASAELLAPASREITIEPGRTEVETFGLLPPRNVLEPVVVHASRYALLRGRQASAHAMSRARLEALPALGGDPIRAASRLPGVASTGFGAPFNVRGGATDETGVLLDGLQLFEPFHLKNFQEVFSMVDGRLVSHMEVFTGGFPAQYGNRLSGIINIRSLRPTSPPHHELYVDLFHSGALSLGRFNDDSTEWLASIRRGNLDLVADALDPDFGQPAYLDAQARIGHRLSDTLSITANAMYGRDDIEMTASEIGEFAQAEYRSGYLWSTILFEPSPSVLARTQVAWTQVDNERRGFIDEAADMAAQVSDLRDYSVFQIQQDWEWALSTRVTAKWGFDVRRVRAKYDYFSTATFEEPLEQLITGETRTHRALNSPSGHQYSLYTSNLFTLSERLSAQLGLRWDRQTYYDFGADEQLSPRLSLMFAPGEATALRASWGRFYQPQEINELQVIDGISRFFRPQRSEHLIVALEHVFANDMQLRVEAYNKRVTRLRPRFENLFDPIELLPELQSDRVGFAPERARSRGIELMLSAGNPTDTFLWWMSFAHARSEDVIDGIAVPRSWDQRNALAGGIRLKRGPWTIAAAARYRSGWPTTEIFLDEVGGGGDAEDGLRLDARNQSRLGDYASLDVRASRGGETRRGRWTAYFEATNLLNFRNECCVGYDLEDGPEGAALTRSIDHWLPVIPNIGFVWEF